MSQHQSFQVDCASWKHVQIFCDPALRRGRPLTVRLPFSVEPGQRIGLILELPDQTCVEIESLVQGATRGGDGRTSARLQLVGLDLATVSRLGRLMAEDGIIVSELADDVDGCPRPEHAPEELIEAWDHMRHSGALAVLGLEEGCTEADVEEAMYSRLLEYHPDVLVAQGIEPHIGREIIIELERARYAVRRRVSPRADYRLSGAVLCSANIDDWYAPAPLPSRQQQVPTDESTQPAQEVVEGVSIDPRDEALDLLDAGKPTEARVRLADALRDHPRDRELRGLYHFAYASELLERGDPVRATTQLEAALAHDPECVRAQRAREALHGKKRGQSPLWRRLFGGD